MTNPELIESVLDAYVPVALLVITVGLLIIWRMH